MKRFLSVALAIILAIGALPVSPASAQTAVTGPHDLGFAYALDYGKWTFRSNNTGTLAAGSVVITVQNDYTAVTGDGRAFIPFATNAPVLLDAASANAETVTPTAVTCASGQLQGTCSFSLTTNNQHVGNFTLQSGTFGICEAANNLLGTYGGGTVVVANGFGGTTSTITTSTLAGACASSKVNILDTRNGAFQSYSLQPSALTSLAVPTTLTGSTATFAGTGTWNNTYFQCVTYVDILGGEGPCSLSFSQASGSNTIATYLSPAASTGAVGWRAYAGLSYNAAYLVPITSSNCTLTTLEQVMPACAIGSNAVFSAPPATTTTLRPNATVSAGALTTPTVNIANPQPQGHTTFAYAPVVQGPIVPFQTHYGPFPQFGSLTAGQVVHLGSINMPAGFLNTIGRTVVLKGKLVLGTTNTATLPTLAAVLSWAGGTTAGVGITTCSFTTAATGSTVAYNGEFECTLTTNAVGATAIGTLMTGGSVVYQVQTGAAAGLGPNVDLNNAVVGSLGLFAQDTIDIVYTSTTNATATEQLMDLHVVVLQ